MPKLLNSAKKLLVNFAIVGALCSGCASCRLSPPRQVLCLLNTSSEDASQWYSDCFDTELDDNGAILSLSQMDKYICRSPDDEQVLEDWIKRVLKETDGDNSMRIASQPLPIMRIMSRKALGGYNVLP